jgi:hypothetical protein
VQHASDYVLFVHRIITDMGLVGLPTGISSAERNHHASSLDELLELMTSMIVFASIRDTGRLPALRAAKNEWTSAVALADTPSTVLPSVLRFDGLHMKRILGMWDDHTKRAPETAAMYLSVTKREYVLGIGAAALVTAIANDDNPAIAREIGTSERVTAVAHGAR